MLSKPNLQEIYSRILTFWDKSPAMFSEERVYSHVAAGAAQMLLEYASQLSELSIPDSQDAKVLLRWCDLFGMSQIPASAAEISIAIESTEPVFLPTSTTWRHESGAVYKLVDPVELSGAAIVTVSCETPGVRGNVDPGSELNITATTPGLKSAGEVAQINKQGFDIEGLDRLRERLRERLRRPPQGGCAYDYINWALEHPAVSQAWVLPRPPDSGGTPQNGHVNIVVKIDQGSATTSELSEIENLIKEKCPISACPHVVSASKVPLDIHLDVDSDGTISNEDLKAKIHLELEYVIQCLSAPRGYLNKNLKKECGTIYLSSISQAISIIPEIKNHRIIRPSKHVAPKKDGQMIALREVSI